MREIKFRLRIGDEFVGWEKWFPGSLQKGELNLLNPSDKVIAAVFIKNSSGVWLYSFDNKRWADKFIPHAHKDQFTNSYDQTKESRKEIYEGDTVRNMDGEEELIGKVIWDVDAFIVRLPRQQGVDEDIKANYVQLGFMDWEIVSPELLEKKL